MTIEFAAACGWFFVTMCFIFFCGLAVFVIVGALTGGLTRYSVLESFKKENYTFWLISKKVLWFKPTTSFVHVKGRNISKHCYRTSETNGEVEDEVRQAIYAHGHAEENRLEVKEAYELLLEEEYA